MNKSLRMALATGVVGATMPIGLALAQTANETGGLEEIVVTAEKVSSDLQKTPVSVATISGQELEEEGKTDLSAALSAASAVTIDTGPAGFLVRIRGAGLDLPPTVGSPAVAISRDGVFDGEILDTFVGFFDVKQVEALRGPQGTLYGRSATGGEINVVTNDPVNQFQSAGVFEVGNYDLLHVDEMVNLPLDDNWSMRIAGTSIYHSGYLSNGQNSADNKAGRFKLLYKPNEDLSILIGAEYGDVGGTAAGAVTGFGTSQPSNPWTDPDPDDNWWTNLIQKYYVKYEQNVGIGELTILPAYQWNSSVWHYHFGVTPPPLLEAQYLVTGWEQKSVEARLASLPSSKVTWVVGAYYYDNPENAASNNLINVAQTPTNPGTPANLQTDGLYPSDPSYQKEMRGVRSEAVFAQATYPITDTLRATGGLRESRDYQSEWAVANMAAGRLPNPNAPGTFYSYTNASGSWSYLDFKAALETDLTANSLAYLQASTAHLPGGFDTADNSEFQPERDVAYELGSKNRFLDNTLQVNAELFDNEYTDFQVSDQMFNPLYHVVLLHVGTASARSYGGEVETSYLLTRADRFDVSLAYLHARYGVFADARQSNYNGSPFSDAPDWTVTAAYQHIFDMGSVGKLIPQIDTRYHSTYYLVPGQGAYLPPFFPAQIAVEPSAHVSDARLQYASANGLWDLTAHISNLENHATKETMFGPTLALGAPRTYGLTFTYHYDGHK